MAKFYDTLLGEYIRNPGYRGLSLDKLSEKYFDYEMIHYDDITNKKKISFEEIPLDLASKYSGEDVYITYKLFEKQKKDKIVENKVLNLIELPLLEVLKDMEISGVKVDREVLKRIGKILEEEIKGLEVVIYDLAGEKFNINSPKQVGEILFEKLKIPKGKKTKTGYSVGIEVLENLAKDYEIAEKILFYRHYKKILSTYVDGILKILFPEDFVYTSYNQAVTATGRLSSTDPNLQNIPGGDGLAGEIREAFVSRFENGKIMSFDYSQVEVRILAILSGEEHLIESFKKGEDIHKKTAEFIFETSEISASQRKIAKGVNFGVIYGISAFGLSKMINISVKDAKKYIDKFFIKYAGVQNFFDEVIVLAKKNGYVESLFGRRRYIPGINDRNKVIQNSAIREAKNMIIQATAADVIKLAMIDVKKFMTSPQPSPTGEGAMNLKSKMIIQVHDELIFDVFPGEEEILEKNIKNIMENILQTYKKDFAFKLEENNLLNLKVDCGVGKNWKQAK